jgi:hypothetical protein
VRGDARASTRIFRLTNPGTHALLIESVTISGRNPRDFVVVQSPGSGGAVEPGGRAILKVRFDPAGARLRKSVVTIRTNDPDNPEYTFGIGGQAVDPARMTVTRISDRDYLAYQIFNTGGRTLNVSASVSEYGAFIYHYRIAEPPPSRIAPGGSGVVRIMRGLAVEKTLNLSTNAAGMNYVRIDLP